MVLEIELKSFRRNSIRILRWKEDRVTQSLCFLMASVTCGLTPSPGPPGTLSRQLSASPAVSVPSSLRDNQPPVLQASPDLPLLNRSLFSASTFSIYCLLHTGYQMNIALLFCPLWHICAYCTVSGVGYVLIY